MFKSRPGPEVKVYTLVLPSSRYYVKQIYLPDSRENCLFDIKELD